MKYNNILRTKQIKNLLYEYKIQLPNKRKSKSISYSFTSNMLTSSNFTYN